MMKHLKIRNNADGWPLGDKIAFHFLEIDSGGVVQKVVDVDAKGNVIDVAPTESNPFGAVDHPPLSQDSDWVDDEISEGGFQAVWAKARDTEGEANNTSEVTSGGREDASPGGSST